MQISRISSLPSTVKFSRNSTGFITSASLPGDSESKPPLDKTRTNRFAPILRVIKQFAMQLKLFASPDEAEKALYRELASHV